MTVASLIAALQAFPSESEVFLLDDVSGDFVCVGSVEMAEVGQEQPLLIIWPK